jgi:hypothetical protein
MGTPPPPLRLSQHPPLAQAPRVDGRPRKGVPKGENVTIAHTIKFWMLLNQIESLELISGD